MSNNLNGTPFSGVQQMRAGPTTQMSQGTQSPLIDKNISPGQFLCSVQNGDGTVFQLPGGQLVKVQNLNGLSNSGRMHGRSASTNAITQRYSFQNPQMLATYQPNSISRDVAQDNMAGLHQFNFPAANVGPNNSYLTNQSSQGPNIMNGNIVN